MTVQRLLARSGLAAMVLLAGACLGGSHYSSHPDYGYGIGPQDRHFGGHLGGFHHFRFGGHHGYPGGFRAGGGHRGGYGGRH